MTNPPPIPDKDEGITLRIVLSHIQHHVHRLEKKIDNIDGKLTKFNDNFKEFAHGVDELDDRVQDIENENMPKRLKRIESNLSLAA